MTKADLVIAVGTIEKVRGYVTLRDLKHIVGQARQAAAAPAKVLRAA